MRVHKGKTMASRADILAYAMSEERKMMEVALAPLREFWEVNARLQKDVNRYLAPLLSAQELANSAMKPLLSAYASMQSFANAYPKALFEVNAQLLAFQRDFVANYATELELARSAIVKEHAELEDTQFTKAFAEIADSLASRKTLGSEPSELDLEQVIAAVGNSFEADRESLKSFAEMRDAYFALSDEPAVRAVVSEVMSKKFESFLQMLMSLWLTLEKAGFGTVALGLACNFGSGAIDRSVDHWNKKESLEGSDIWFASFSVVVIVLWMFRQHAIATQKELPRQ